MLPENADFSTSCLSLSAFMPGSLPPVPRDLRSHPRGISARWGQLVEDPSPGDATRLDYMVGQDLGDQSPPLIESNDRFFNTNTSQACLGLQLRMRPPCLLEFTAPKATEGLWQDCLQVAHSDTCAWTHGLNDFSPPSAVLLGIPSAISRPPKISKCLL